MKKLSSPVVSSMTFKTKLRLGRYGIYISLAYLIFFGIASNLVKAEDWTTYRYDGVRSGVTSEKVSAPLSPQWTFKPNHTPKPAWPLPGEELPRMHSDNAYHVAVADGMVYFGSSVDNKVYALDSETGKVLWTFFTEGPVRFAPSIWNEKVYVGSDDGYVYCLESKSGKLVWKYRAGPSDEKVIGNGRMISLWPIRTSVLVDDGVVYFGAGVFPYEGIYICALDADDGTVVWKNDTIGDRAHELDYGGLSPHGYLLASEDVLYVPSGRAMPAAFDRKTGRFLHYLSSGGKVGGTWALLDEDELIAGVGRSGTPAKVAFGDKTGSRKGDVYAWFPGLDMVVTAKISYTLTEKGIRAISRGAYPHLKDKLSSIKADQQNLSAMLSDLKTKLTEVDEKMREEVSKQIDETTQRINALAKEEEETLKNLSCKWQYDREDLYTLITAGSAVLAGGDGVVVAIDTNTGRELWNSKVDGKAYGLAVSDGRLFVSTDQGSIYCFGEKEMASPKVLKPEITDSPYPKDKLTPIYEAAAEQILEETGIEKGYCLVLDAGTGRLAFEIAQWTDLKVVGIEKDPKKVQMAKEKLSAATLYGSQVVVEQWDLSSLPKYFANLIVSDEMTVKGEIDEAKYPATEMFRVLRPYDGVAYFGQTDSDAIEESISEERLLEWLIKSGAPEPEITQDDGLWAKITRGKLEGARGWTHQYADPQNTACSEDQLVKAPLGVLWFGEPGPRKMVERHAKAASPVSMNGRLFIQGEEIIMAYDAYNGTFLWEKEIPGAVRARADVDGGNLALTEDALYVAAHEKCYRLNPATGETIETFEVPKARNTEQASRNPRWAYVSYANSILYGSRANALEREYFALWNVLVDTRDWDVIKDEIPPQYRDQYKSYRARYPNPDEKLLKAFKRGGVLWHFMESYPAWENYDRAKGAVSSRLMDSDTIFAKNPETGKLLWKHQGEQIAHITISIGDGRIFFAESAISDEQKKRAIEERQALAEKRIYKDPEKAKTDYSELDVRMVVCLDATTGEKIWEKPVDFTGCGGDNLATAYHDGVLLFFANMGDHDAWRHQGGSLEWKRLTTLSAENGDMLWSHANNYRTRPLIVGDEIIIEPRTCDVRTGKIKMRKHPITGKKVPWEFLRPGHTCAITSASANALFYRSYCDAIYDLEGDSGVTLFGAIRPGCWINMIPASGLLLAPEASSGCTCSFPLRSTIGLTHKPEHSQPWNVVITHGAMTPAKHFAINLGAPGDMKDEKGTVWFAYPNPETRYAGNHYSGYGVKFNLKEKNLGYFCHDFKSVVIEGTDRPWLFTSGSLGALRCEVPLIDGSWGEGPGVYTVQLGFAAPSGDREDQRVFDVKLQGDVVLEDFDIVEEAGAPNKAVIKEFDEIEVEDNLTVELVSKASNPTIAQVPILNFIKAVENTESRKHRKIEAPKVGKPLERSEAEELLKTAKAEQNQDQASSLKLYHTVLDAASSTELKQQALKGMAAIGSRASLSRIENYCRNTAPILWNYREPTPELIDSAIKVYAAIAKNMVEVDTQKAIKMLKNALTLVKGLEARQKIVNTLDNLDVQIDAEAAKAGFITRWHLIGPFPRANGADWKTSLDKVSVDEPNISLSKSYQIGTKELKWTKYTASQGKIDLKKLFTPNTYVSIYAYAEVVLPEEQKLLLKVGSDDAFKCWFNGKEVGRFEGPRSWTVDENTLEAKGKKGVNTVLLKITQSGSAWAFSVSY